MKPRNRGMALALGLVFAAGLLACDGMRSSRHRGRPTGAELGPAPDAGDGEGGAFTPVYSPQPGDVQL